MQSEIIFNDGSRRAKPFPDLFIAATEKLKIPAIETVFFED